MKKLIPYLFCFFALGTFAQEKLIDLHTNPQLYVNTVQQESVRGGVSDSIFVYLIDTLNIPFADDFSRNRQKKYNAKITDQGVFQANYIRYLFNGNYQDTLLYLNDTSYSYVSNPNTSKWDTIPNPFIVVEEFDSIFPFTGKNIDTVWEAKSTYTVNNQITQIEQLNPDGVFYNRNVDKYIVPDDNYSVWLDSDAFINNTFAIDPPTIGVATMDGIDADGFAYDITVSQSSSGLADKLTSKPFNLTSTMADVYLSFFYQPVGNGNEPEEKDSLVLQFFSPDNDEWISVWSTPGIPFQNFQQVLVPVADAKYLKKGFQFRFINYATLSGSLDHWHIDYVRLDENRSSNDTDIDDVAFQYMPPSFIEDYTAMPWNHYDNTFMKGDVTEELNNLSTVNKLVTNQYFVEDETSTQIFASTPVNNTSTPAQQTFTIDHSVSNNPNNFDFPTLTNRTVFTVEHRTNTTPDINRNNDTIFRPQVFDTYYAYDDGTAEKGYSLVGANSRVAYEFQVDKADTLEAVQIYFPPLLEDVTQLPFVITVWSKIGDDENIIYDNLLFNPIYSELGKFVRFELDETVIVNGQYYVGYRQINADRLYVGFDVNINNQDKIFYNTGGSWFSTQFEGSLMIRPDFGAPAPPPISIAEEKEKTKNLQLTLYPNPAKHNVQVKTSSPAFVEVFDLMGKPLLLQQITKQGSFDVSQLAQGIYFVKATTAKGISTTQRLIIAN